MALAQSISIHALLAESDHFEITITDIDFHFYPRSPCGERLDISTDPTFSRYFYPRSPCGERPYYMQWDITDTVISIHALLAESDQPMYL